MRVKNSQSKQINGLFEAFENENITFVVLRKYEGLPEEEQDDIDLQIKAEDFEEAVAVCESLSFENTHSTSKEFVDLVVRTISSPKKAIYWLQNKPKDILYEITSTSNPYSTGAHGHKSIRLTSDNVLLDIKKHLAYKSPMNGQRIRIHPFVEEKLFDRRQEYNGFYIPSPPDELAHIVCHCLFDKNGTFTAYYEQRCDELMQEISQDEELQSQFWELLGYLFFDADEFVYNKIDSGQYDDLLEQLYAYDEY